jgi:FkbM family methyltransferase
MNVKRVIKDLLRPYKHHMPWLRTELSWTTSLTKFGLVPVTVFDIGVAFGTWELYKMYPEAHYHLIEPAKEGWPYMEKIQRYMKGRAELHFIALSDHDGMANFAIHKDLLGSSMMTDFNDKANVVRFDTVPMRRFDHMFPKFRTPALVKIDVQGAELMVLRGMEGVIDKVAAVIVETSTLSTVKDGPEVRDIISLMSEYDFVLADVMGMLRRPLDDMTAQLDLLFIPNNAGQRRNRQWFAV